MCISVKIYLEKNKANDQCLVIKLRMKLERLAVLFINLFICWSNRMAACCFAVILLLYAPPKITSVLVLFVVFGGFLIYCYIGRPSQASLATSVAYPVAFISLFAATYSQPTTRRQLINCGHEHTLLYLLYSFRYLRITVAVDRNHLFLNQEQSIC